ncbi:MAG: hypothetical protein KDD53_03940 [Bdellovibrionales bacterium]|nr:hypothetical protein [Bdellovibrionales bacterium]
METKPKVEYITDDEGKRKVVLPVETYEEMLEDIQDLAAIAERKNESSVSLDELLRNLKSDGFL